MKTFSLNAAIFKECVEWTENIERRGKRSNYEERLYKECVYLFSEPGLLKYVVGTTYSLVEFTESVGFGLDISPLIVDVGEVRHKNLASGGRSRIDLEIPDCTWASLSAFHDKKRKSWITDADLGTRVVCLADCKAELEYRKPLGYKYLLELPPTKIPFESFCWNPVLKTYHAINDKNYNSSVCRNEDPDGIYRQFCDVNGGGCCRRGQDFKGCDFGYAFNKVLCLLKWRDRSYSREYYEDPVLPDSVHVGIGYGTDDEQVPPQTVRFETPIAKWERDFTKADGYMADCHVRILAFGKSRQL